MTNNKNSNNKNIIANLVTCNTLNYYILKAVHEIRKVKYENIYIF